MNNIKQIDIKIAAHDKEVAIAILEKIIAKIETKGIDKNFFSEAFNNGNYYVIIDQAGK